MFLPLSDSPNSTEHPWVSYVLMVLNFLVFFAIMWPASLHSINWFTPEIVDLSQTIPPESPLSKLLDLDRATFRTLIIYRFGYHPGNPSALGLITGMFLHGGLFHLLGNMLFLFIFGDNVEARLGHVKFLLFYLACGAAGALFNTLLLPESQGVGLGASGAIYGILGYYFLSFPENRVRVFTFLFPFFVGMLSIPARFVIGIYFLISDVVPYLVTSPLAGGASHAAHLSGFVFGLGLALAGVLWRRIIASRSPSA